MGPGGRVPGGGGGEGGAGRGGGLRVQGVGLGCSVCSKCGAEAVKRLRCRRPFVQGHLSMFIPLLQVFGGK